jgi:hypothetical protein
MKWNLRCRIVALAIAMATLSMGLDWDIVTPTEGTHVAPFESISGGGTGQANAPYAFNVYEGTSQSPLNGATGEVDEFGSWDAVVEPPASLGNTWNTTDHEIDAVCKIIHGGVVKDTVGVILDEGIP